jgi:hypothetical protein
VTPPILTIMHMEFQFHHRAIPAHASNFLRHNYACSSLGDIFSSSLDRSTMPALYPQLPCSFSCPSRHRHSSSSRSPLSPRRSPALLQLHHSMHYVVTRTRYWRADSFRANLKMVDVGPSSSATTTSQPPQATSRCGSGPSDHHEKNYFIHDKG